MANFDKAIPPGEEGKITLKVRTKGYQGMIRKAATVSTNDPTNRNVVLVVKAMVKVPIYVSSRYVQFSGRGDWKIGKTVKIRAELDKPLNLTVVEFTLKDKLKYTLKTILKGKEYQIQFTYQPTAKENFNGFLKIKTDYPEMPEITIVIHGRFNQARHPGNAGLQNMKKRAPSNPPTATKAPIYVSSRYIRLYGKKNQEISKIAEVNAKLDKPLNLTVADFTLKDKLKYTIETIENGKKYQVKFTTLPGVNYKYNGILKLKTNYPEMPAITFVIHGRFTESKDNAQ